MYRVEEAIEDLYRSTQYRPDFLADVRSLIADTVGNQDEAQRALKRQLDSQLAALEGQEENLLDLAAGGSVATDKIRLRLNKITQERERLVHQRDAVALDLTAGATYLEAQLSLLEEPFDLYRDASDEVRRRLTRRSSELSTSCRAEWSMPPSSLLTTAFTQHRRPTRQ